MRTRRARYALWLFLAIFVTWPTTLSAQWPFSGVRREIRIGIVGLPASLEPAAMLEGAGPLITRQAFDTLVAYREGSTDVEPALATRWAVSRDGLVWTFQLRETVRFHDGAPLTSSAVVASFDRQVRGGQSATVWAALLRGVPGVVREIRAADSRTVEFVLTQPYAALLTVLAHPGFSVVRQVTANDGSVRLVGTGPFRVAEETPGRLALDAVSGHWSGVSRTERLVFLEVSSDDHAEAELDARGLDIWFPGGPPRRTESALSIPGLRIGYLAFQTEKEPFSKKKVRQAIAAAIDPGVLAVALGRAAVPLQSFLPTGMWARREGSPLLGGTRNTVASLLAEAAWPRGFSPTLLVPADLPSVSAPSLGEALQLSLQAADIGVKIRLEAEVAAAAIRAAGEHELAVAEATALGGDPHLLLYPLSTSEGAMKGPRALNLSFYRNPRLDDMLIRASQIGYRPERQRLYQRAQAVLADEMPWLPLYVRLVWAVVRPEVRGLRLHPTGFHRLMTVGLEGS